MSQEPSKESAIEQVMDWANSVNCKSAFQPTIDQAKSELASLRAELERVKQERDEAVDLVDMAHDEFKRIHSLSWSDDPPRLGEIRGLCERGMAKIRQNVPVIVQRDEALNQLAAARRLSGEAEHIISVRLGSHRPLDDYEQDIATQLKELAQPGSDGGKG